MKRVYSVFILVFVMAMFLMVNGSAVAADQSGADAASPKYKKVTGEVVSANPSRIVVKGKSEPITIAVNDKTDVVGGSGVKAGDRAAVNYRIDKNGKTATRIKILSTASAPKPGSVASTSQNK